LSTVGSVAFGPKYLSSNESYEAAAEAALEDAALADVLALLAWVVAVDALAAALVACVVAVDALVAALVACVVAVDAEPAAAVAEAAAAVAEAAAAALVPTQSLGEDAGVSPTVVLNAV
jgi:hypothetical protein